MTNTVDRQTDWSARLYTSCCVLRGRLGGCRDQHGRVPGSAGKVWDMEIMAVGSRPEDFLH